MNTIINLKVEELTQESFMEYGKVIKVPETSPHKIGDGWDCWSYLGMLDVEVPIGMGLVKTKIRDFKVDEMERHVSREELLLPTEKAIIQPVAKCINIEDPNERPDPQTVKCFLIKPGEAIVINKGVWHSPAYPADEDTTYLFAIEKKKDAFGDEMVNPWVKFENDVVIAFS